LGPKHYNLHMWLTEFMAVRAELIAIENVDRKLGPIGNEESFAFMLRQVRRHELLKQFADPIAKN
jgi:hypothetical protein